MQTNLNRDVLITLLRREVTRAPVGISIGMNAPTLRSAALVFFVRESDLGDSGYDFLESILRGMKIDRKRVLMTANPQDITNSAKYLVVFGRELKINRPNFEMFETLSVEELQSNIHEKKKLWNQLKVWIQLL